MHFLKGHILRRMPQPPSTPLVTTSGVTHYNVEGGVANFKKENCKMNVIEDIFTKEFFSNSKSYNETKLFHHFVMFHC